MILERVLFCVAGFRSRESVGISANSGDMLFLGSLRFNPQNIFRLMLLGMVSEWCESYRYIYNSPLTRYM